MHTFQSAWLVPWHRSSQQNPASVKWSVLNQYILNASVSGELATPLFLHALTSKEGLAPLASSWHGGLTDVMNGKASMEKQLDTRRTSTVEKSTKPVCNFTKKKIIRINSGRDLLTSGSRTRGVESTNTWPTFSRNCMGEGEVKGKWNRNQNFMHLRLDSQVLSRFQGSRDLHSDPSVSNVVDWIAWDWNGKDRQLYKLYIYHNLLHVMSWRRLLAQN